MTKLEQIKVDSMTALKEGNKFKRSVINNFLSEMKNDDFSDDVKFDTFLNKFVKKLSDSKEEFVKHGKDVNDLENEISILKEYLPLMLSEEEIKTIIESLESKEMKDVMTHFKTNYQGKVDMGLVSKTLRGI